MDIKICSQCKIKLPTTCFSPNGSKLRSNCKLCQAAKRRKFVSENKEKVLLQTRISAKKHKNSIQKKKKEYHIKNRENILEKHHIYYSDNKEKILAKNKKYAKEHPEVGVVRSQNRRARMNKCFSNITGAEIKSLKEKYKYRCAYCKCKTDKNNPLQIDHKVPLSKGGAHILENILPSCRKCNLSKFTMDWNDWCLKINFKENYDDENSSINK